MLALLLASLKSPRRGHTHTGLRTVRGRPYRGLLQARHSPKLSPRLSLSLLVTLCLCHAKCSTLFYGADLELLRGPQQTPRTRPKGCS